MRTANRILAAVVAILLLAGGILLAVEIVIGLAGGDSRVIPYDTWYREAREHGWSSTPVRWLLVGLGAVGAAILLMQLLPRRPSTLPVATDDDTEFVVTRPSLESSLAHAAERIDGIDRAKARVRKGAVAVKARSHRRTLGDLPAQVTAVVRALHDELQPNRSRTVRVDVDYRKN
jgi:hypothetical protein